MKFSSFQIYSVYILLFLVLLGFPVIEIIPSNYFLYISSAAITNSITGWTPLTFTFSNFPQRNRSLSSDLPSLGFFLLLNLLFTIHFPPTSPNIWFLKQFFCFLNMPFSSSNRAGVDAKAIDSSILLSNAFNLVSSAFLSHSMSMKHNVISRIGIISSLFLGLVISLLRSVFFRVTKKNPFVF